MWSHSNNCEFITTSCQHGASICCCINAPDLFSDCIKTSLCVFLSVICCHMFRFSFLKSIKRIEKFPQSSFFFWRKNTFDANFTVFSVTTNKELQVQTVKRDRGPHCFVRHSHTEVCSHTLGFWTSVITFYCEVSLQEVNKSQCDVLWSDENTALPVSLSDTLIDSEQDNWPWRSKVRGKLPLLCVLSCSWRQRDVLCSRVVTEAINTSIKIKLQWNRGISVVSSP